MSRIVEYIVNNELEGIWKEAIEVFRYYPVIYLIKPRTISFRAEIKTKSSL
jgi:hypothetical protein